MGKKFHFSTLFVLFSICCNNFTFAEEALTFERINPNSERSLTQTYHEKRPCTIGLDQLIYVGLHFDTTDAFCIDASNDKDAGRLCNRLGPTFRAINPANPQYLQNPGGVRDQNPAGYYYCVRPDAGDKKHLCSVVAKEKSYFLEADPYLDFHWEPVDKSKPKGDGNCYCGLKGPTAEYKNNDSFACDLGIRPDAFGLCQYKNADLLVDLSRDDWNSAQADVRLNYSCKCKNDPDKIYYPLTTAEASCKNKIAKINSKFEKETVAPPPPAVETEVAALAPPVPAAKTETPPPEPAPSSDLKACIKTWKTEVDKCKTQADEAKKSCTVDEKENKAASGVIGATGEIYTKINAGKGAQQECFTASLVANSAKQVINSATSECTTSMGICGNTCDKLADIEQSCREKIKTAASATENQIALNQAEFDAAADNINEKAAEGIKTCGKDAEKGKSLLSDSLISIGNSLQSSLKCMCQLSSGNTGDCNAIPTISICNANPSNPNCGVLGAVDVCTPGNTYDAKLCGCQTNPKTAGCPAYASGGLSNFASPTLKNPTGSASSNIGIAGGLKVGSDDIAMPTSDEDTGVTPKLDFPGGGASAGGPGGPGGGLGGAGGGSGGAPAAEGAVVPEEKGLSGLFNLAKSYISGAFGKKKFDNGNLKNGKPVNTGADVNKFRPTRGVASKNGSGTKNQDIWLRMNRCFVAETCQGNNNNFLDSALKQK